MLVNENLAAGTYETEFDAKDYPSGMYYYTLYITGNPADTIRMVLVK